jgi:hypothetical protein
MLVLRCAIHMVRHLFEEEHEKRCSLVQDVRDSVGTTSNSLVARLAVPDTDGMTLDVDLAAESASVLGVLCDFHLLDLLTQGSTVSARRKFPSAIRSSIVVRTNHVVSRYGGWSWV